MWYKQGMRSRTHRFLKNVTRLLYALILISGVAGPAALIAAQLGCEPACSMHQAHQAYQIEATPSSCCDVAGAVHQKIDSCHEISDKKQMAPSACCDDKLCFDSHIEIEQTAALSSGSADPTDPVAAASKLPVLTSIPSKFPCKQLSLDLISPEKPIPIYLRTCVFLI